MSPRHEMLLLILVYGWMVALGAAVVSLAAYGIMIAARVRPPWLVGSFAALTGLVPAAALVYGVVA